MKNIIDLPFKGGDKTGEVLFFWGVEHTAIVSANLRGRVIRESSNYLYLTDSTPLHMIGWICYVTLLIIQ